MFIFLQLYAFFFHPSYSQNQAVTYLDSNVGEEAGPYKIEAGEFTPTYYIYTEDTHTDPDQTIMTYNDETKFKFYYKESDKDTGEDKFIEAILCTEYIDGEFWAEFSDEEKANAKS